MNGRYYTDFTPDIEPNLIKLAYVTHPPLHETLS